MTSPARQARHRSALCAALALLLLLGVAGPTPADEPSRGVHAPLFDLDDYPPASACRSCHPQQYREWAASPHAYAQLSVVYQSMQSAIVTLTNGTTGDFCIRCHTPVGMTLGEPIVLENEKRHPVSREGVTCIACHRIDRSYGRISGRLPIQEGPLCDVIYGPSGGPDGRNTEVERVLDDPAFRVAGCDETGRTIHEEALRRDFITTSSPCGSCHDVRLVNGFRLEDTFSEYKASPAAHAGVSCQDCHMGREPGLPSGYRTGPAAIVGGEPTRERKLSDHTFAGPDYSILHPGIFPHDDKAAKLASLSEWLAFDHRAGWGDPKSDFEKRARKDKPAFPRAWRTLGRRKRARKLIDQNCRALDTVQQARVALLQVGYRLGDVVVERADEDGLRFRVEVASGTDGHAVPTGFDAERLVFLQVVVRDADGAVVHESGDRDPNGDLRDLHSLYVHDGALPLDRELLSLQSKFLTRNLRGSEREQVLPVNFSPDPLPFLRPESRPTGIYGRPRSTRKHKQVLLPGARRFATYEVARDQLTGRAPYTVDVELVAQMVPVNLIAEISFMGFEYGMSAKEVADRVVAGADVLWRKQLVLEQGRVHDDEAEAVAPTGAFQCRSDP